MSEASYVRLHRFNIFEFSRQKFKLVSTIQTIECITYFLLQIQCGYWLEVARISWKRCVKIIAETVERWIGQKWKPVISVLSGSFGFPDRSRIEKYSTFLRNFEWLLQTRQFGHRWQTKSWPDTSMFILYNNKCNLGTR